MLKKCGLALMLALLALTTMVGCSRKENAKKVLHVYSWDAYFSPVLIQEFEKQFDCLIQIDTFDSNEAMFAKLDAGGGGYDIIVPSHYFVQKMAKKGMIAPLDLMKLPNIKEIDPVISQKLGTAVTNYAVPYFMSYTGIGYDTSIKDFQPSWEIMLARPDLKGRITLLDDQMEVIGAAMMTLGLKTADLLDPTKGPANCEKVYQLAVKWRDNASKFENEQYKNGLASGEFSLVMGYGSDLAQIVAENSGKLGFVMPREGSFLSCDMLVISSSSQEPALACEFLNFLLDPKNSARNMEVVFANSPNPAAHKLLPAEIENNNAIRISDEIIARSEFTPELTPEQEQVFEKPWIRIRNAEK